MQPRKRNRPLADRKITRGPITPFWKGETVVLVAAGPSLTEGQAATVREHWCLGRCRVIAVNRGYERAPWADALYAADLKFWREYIPLIRDVNIDLMFSTTEQACHEFGLWYVPGPEQKHAAKGLSLDPNLIHWGGHSGFQAFNIAVHALGGQGRIVLLGYDCKSINGKRHFHPDHKNMPNAPKADTWPAAYEGALDSLAETSIEVINATPDSAINCFPRMSIGAALSELRATA